MLYQRYLAKTEKNFTQISKITKNAKNGYVLTKPKKIQKSLLKKICSKLSVDIPCKISLLYV